MTAKNTLDPKLLKWNPLPTIALVSCKIMALITTVNSPNVNNRNGIENTNSKGFTSTFKIDRTTAANKAIQTLETTNKRGKNTLYPINTNAEVTTFGIKPIFILLNRPIHLFIS